MIGDREKGSRVRKVLQDLAPELCRGEEPGIGVEGRIGP